MVALLCAQVHRLSTTHSLAASINRLGFTPRSDPPRDGKRKPRRGAGLALQILRCDSLQSAADRDAGQALARSHPMALHPQGSALVLGDSPWSGPARILRHCSGTSSAIRLAGCVLIRSSTSRK
jgi:hypothetical protein